MKKPRRRCRNCGRYFEICPKVKKHNYCKLYDCQKARKRAWQNCKMAKDQRYRQDQEEAKKIWRTNNSDYWGKYRSKNKRYTEKNRLQQKQRNRTKRALSKGGSKFDQIAKMDALIDKNNISSGRYTLMPIGVSGIAKMDALIVQIDVIKEGYKFFDS